MSSLRPAREGVLEVSGRGPVQLRIIPTDATSALLEIGVDYSQADVPSLHYDADFASVVQGRIDPILIFGKLKSGSDGTLRTKIEISFARKQFLAMWKNTQGVLKSAKHVSRGNLPEPVHVRGDAERVQCLRANNVFVAMMEDEAVLDFYYISPGDIHLARTKSRSAIHLEAVARVCVATPVLYEFLEMCRPLAEQLGSLETPAITDDTREGA